MITNVKTIKINCQSAVIRDKCNGCQDCFPACPYGVPQFGKDGTMQECNFCIEYGGEPACAVSCPSEAVKFGTLDDLLEMTTLKTARRMDGVTGPSIVMVS